MRNRDRNGLLLDFANEAITTPRDGLNEAGCLGTVIQRRPQPFHGIVQPLFKVHESVGWPQLLLQLFSADGLARTLQQHDQYVHWLALQLDLHSLLAEFSSSWIKLEHAKMQSRRQ